MTPPISRSSIPSLSEHCLESYLSAGLDHHLPPQEREHLDEIFFQYMWANLKADVPKGALGLQTTISEIEDAYAPENSEKSLESKNSHFFRKLAQAFAPEFEEASIALNHRVPCSTSEYTQLQKTLRKKWSDETLLILWTGSGGLQKVLNSLGAFRRKPVPISPQEIRKWLTRPKNAVFLNQVEGINLNKLKVRVCPLTINRFQLLIRLNLQKNNLHSFSCDLRPCKKLKELFLSHNRIQTFAPKLSNDSKIEWIDLRMNKLDSFSLNLEECPKLKCLDLSFNQITNFSSSLWRCTSLETLNLSFNKMRTFSFQLMPHENARVLLARNPLLKPITPRGFIRNTSPQILVLPPSPRGAAPAAVARTDQALLAPHQPTEAERSPKPKRLQSPP